MSVSFVQSRAAFQCYSIKRCNREQTKENISELYTEEERKNVQDMSWCAQSTCNRNAMKMDVRKCEYK